MIPPIQALHDSGFNWYGCSFVILGCGLLTSGLWIGALLGRHLSLRVLEWSILLFQLLNLLKHVSILILAIDSSITLYGLTLAKKLANVSGYRPCKSFQRSVPNFTPAIWKLFRVSFEVGLTRGTFELKCLKYSLRVSFSFCLMLASILAGGAYTTETLKWPINSSFVHLQGLMEFAGSFLNQWWTLSRRVATNKRHLVRSKI